jgi:tRNA 2-selenouridine synthase
VAEAESSKIGERVTPPLVWKAMQAAPRVQLEAERGARAHYLVEAYADIVEDPARLQEALARLPLREIGRERLAAWRELAATREFVGLAEALMEAHYDPAYDRSARKDERPTLASVRLASLDAVGQERAAAEIEGLLSSVQSGFPTSETAETRRGR